VEPTSSAVLGEKFLRALDLIAEAAPEVGSWLIARSPSDRQLISIEDARRIMPKIMEDNVSTDDNDEADPDYGYALMAFNGRGLRSGSINLTAGAGGRFGDRISFRVGFIDVPSDPAVVTYRLFRAALLSIVGIWPSVWANANAYRADYYKAPTAPGVPPHPYSRFHLPWLSYLSAPLAKGLTLPADILTERTPDGGLLMIAAEERLDPANPEQMRRSRAIAEIMIARAGDPKGGVVPVDFNTFLGLPPRH
jgi:hypothetical protein